MRPAPQMRPELQQFAQPKPNEEALRWSWYDIKDFSAGSAISSTNTFFARAVDGSTVTYEDTNMPVASQLQQGNRFLCDGIGVSVMSAHNDTTPYQQNIAVGTVTEIDDRLLIMMRGFLELKLLAQKSYVQGCPIAMFPAGF